MPNLTLTTPFNLGNGTRIIFGTFDFNDDLELVWVDVELRTPVGAPQPDALLCQFRSEIRNGICTVHTRVASPPSAIAIGASSRYISASTRSLPGGYDSAVAARDAAAPKNKAARRLALEAFWLSAGHIVGPGLAYA